MVYSEVNEQTLWVHEASVTRVRIRFILEVGGMVNNPRLQVLNYPSELSVCLGLGGNGKECMFVSLCLCLTYLQTH